MARRKTKAPKHVPRLDVTGRFAAVSRLSFAPRGACTSWAIDRVQAAGDTLEGIGKELSIDGSACSNFVADHDPATCRKTAAHLRSVAKRAHAELVEALACAGMFEALASLPNEVPHYVAKYLEEDAPQN